MKASLATLSLAILISACLASISHSQEWGNLKGRFVYGGDPPPMKTIDTSVSNDAHCRQLEVPREDIVVGEKGGLANVVIFMRPGRTQKVPVHSDYAESANDEAVIDNKNCRFEPRVLVMRTSQPLIIKNSDPTGHNSRITPLNPRNPGINPSIPAGGQQSYKFNVEENYPVQVGCNIHIWMSASIFVRDLPYAAVSGEDGTFEIKNIPVGEYPFQVYHTKYVVNVERNGKKETWRSGRPNLTIKPGENDLGDIVISASHFE